MILYDVTIPVFDRFLANLSRLLDLGEAHAKQAGIDQLALTGARLAPNMFTLAQQVYVATDTTAKGGCM